MSSFLEDLHAEVSRVGVETVSQNADLPPATVERFLRDPMDIRISTLSRLCRAVNMAHGKFHLIDQETDRCITCTDPGEVHYPLFPAHT